MEVSLSLAQWVVGKALAPVTDYLLESWAASTGLNPNIDALKMELLYAQGMLENAQDMDIRSSALKELLQKLRQLAYRADDVLDELVYFRIQDALEGTYHATAVHDPGCIDGLIINARHIAKDVASTLKLPSCSCAASHGDPEERENNSKQGDFSCVQSCRGHEIGSNQVTSGARIAAHVVGKHFPSYSFPSMARCRNPVTQTPKLEFNRVEMSKKMVDIVEQLKPVCAKVSTILNLELLSSSRTHRNNSSINKPRTTREFIEPPFCGRYGLEREIVDSVTREFSAKKLTVLPIVGSGGIGKTTLAHHVYKELESHFQVSIWICVSVNFSAKRLIHQIVKMIPEVRGENKKGSDIELIEQRLKYKKFILVLDDVWKCNMDEWKKLLAPLSKGRANGNTVIVTTRFPKVAKMVGTIKCPIEVDRLCNRDMMELFEMCIFGDKKPWQDHPLLHDVGCKIVKNLNGSPLAIKSVGRSLRNQLTLDHWIRVLESKEWEVGSSDHDTMSALRLSYENLPFSLRHCVAYCGLFPEDYEFDQKELIQLWIALDILHSHSSKRSKRVEDVGLHYIDELVNYGFLQKKTRKDGHPYYLIHDLVHELATMVLPYDCLRIHSSNVGSIQIPPSVRHLSIIVDDIDVLDRMSFEQYKTYLSALGKRLKVEDLRTLMLFGEYHGSYANIFGDLFGEARALRTIILSEASYNVVDIFHNFSKFVHLRYLRVKPTYKKDIFLPSALFRFYHLEILDLEEWHGYFGSSRYMSNLVKLRYFHVPEDEIQVHSDIFEVGKLKFLQELRRFVVGKESAGFEPSQLGKLKNIGGSLGIHNLERVQKKELAEEFELMDKNYLEKLTLEWDTDRLNTDPLQEESVLEGLVPHSNIRDLCISGHGGATCPSWLDGDLLVVNLKSLCLYDIAWENLPVACQRNSDQSFRKLTRLELVRIPRLKKIAGNELPSFWFHLEVFIVEDCIELLELPSSQTQDDSITWFPRLRELRIVDCPKLESLPPVPWTVTPCSANIARAGLDFEHLVYSEKYKSELSLSIKGKDGQGSMLWDGLSFSNLINLAELDMEKCPPLSLVHLQMLTSLKVLIICDSSNLLLAAEGESHVECLLPLEDVNIRRCGATGKELTWLLSHSPKITKLSIEYCEKITGLGVAELEQQMRATPETSLADKIQQETREEEMAAEGVLLLPPRLQELEALCCPELQLLSSSLNDDRAGGGGLQGLLSLHTLKIQDCPKFLSSYSSPSSVGFLFPASLEKLTLASLEGMDCGELVGAGLWPLISQTQLRVLVVFETPKFFTSWPHDDELSSSSKHLHLQMDDVGLHLQTDDIAGAASICSGFSSSLTNLSFTKIKMAKRFTKEQEKSLHLLTSLEELKFKSCDKLQRLPAGLINLTNLKRLYIEDCPAIRMLPKGGLPSSLQKLVINACPAFKSLPKKSLPNSRVNDTGGLRTCTVGADKSHYLKTGKTRPRTCNAGAFKSQTPAEPVGRPVFCVLLSRAAHVMPFYCIVFLHKDPWIHGKCCNLIPLFPLFCLVCSCSTPMGEETGGAAGASSCSAASESSATTFNPTMELPRMRTEAVERPIYGPESVKFSVEVHHGGFFVGKGLNQTYLDEKICWFDNLDRNTLCNDCIDYMLAQLNYRGEEKIMCWCPPGKTLADLVEIHLEIHCRNMARASVESKVLVLFVKHVRKTEMQEEDDIVVKGSPVLPEVILSPARKARIRELKSEKVSGSSNNASNAEKSEQQEDAGGQNSDMSENSEVSEEEYECDSDIDPTWYDSDYGMEEDDEDYDENVDDSVEDAMVEKGQNIGAEYRHVPGTDDVNDDDLQLPEEDDCEKKHKSDSDDEEYKKKKKKEKPSYRYILEARELPVLSMYERIKSQIMHRHMSKKKEAVEKWTGNITPKVREKLRKNVELSANCHPEPSGMGVFGVLSNDKTYIVELNMHACTCRRWQLTGIPCSHACACCRHERIKPESMVLSCYSVQTYMLAYGVQVYPSRDKDEWPHVDAVPILPPLYEKRSGRRRKNRRQQPEENKDGTKLSRHGAIMHCGYCKEAGHNRSGCSKLKAAVQREEEDQNEHTDQPEQTENVGSENTENVATEQPGSHSRRGRKRKPTDKMREQIEQMMEKAKKKKSKMVIDENGDVDFPIILTHIQQRTVRPNLDPTQVEDSMVHILSHEGAAQAVPVSRIHQIPDESEFVVQHRANIAARERGPEAATGSGVAAASAQAPVRGRGAGGAAATAQGPGRGRGAGGAAATAQGPGRGRGTGGATGSAHAPGRGRGAGGAAASTRGRGRGTRARRGGSQAGRVPQARGATGGRGDATRYKKSRTKGIKWLLFGEGSSKSGHVEEQTELQCTQEAPTNED